MNLKELYEYENVYNEVEKYIKNTHEKILKLQGYRLEKKEDYKIVFAWKKMNIHFLNIKMNTFISIKIKLDNNNIIKDIELHKNFCGSQNEKCKYDVLNKHIIDTFKNEELSLKNLKIKNMKLCWCRHVYELMYGMCDFITYCNNNSIDNTTYLEENYVHPSINKFTIFDKIYLNNKTSISKVIIKNIKSVKLDNNVNICKSGNINISYEFNNNKILENTIKFDNHNDFYQKTFMETLKIWKELNTQLGLDNLLSFNDLWPTTLFSYIMQLITVYKKISMKALNKCLENFQRKDNKAMCIGFLKEGEVMDD